MQFSRLSEAMRLARLEPPAGRVTMVLDTDTYNEVDDQFAVAYALLSPEKLTVEAIYAAPFFNDRSTGPADGMEKSYQEILRLLELLGKPADGRVFRGSTTYLPDWDHPVESPAALDLIERAMRCSPENEPLVVVAIGAITNVASAILLEPRIIERVVVVWLGGHAFFWPDTREFNLMQDVSAARVIFDSGVPLVQLPCMGVVSHLHTTVAELERYVQGHSRIGDYLTDIVRSYQGNPFAWSKVIWDIASIAYLINAGWTPSALVHSPIVTDDLTWSFDPRRHFIRSVYSIDRDGIFRDLFTRLAQAGAG